MLKGKTVILGVTGGIAAYKIPNLASMLVKQGCDVHVLMTENGAKFITQDTFEALTKNKCIIDTFDRNHPMEIKHISLAKKADYMLIAPATANVIGKLANGIADDMLTTTALACKCPIAVAPAMNVNMYENRIVQDNIEKLRGYGFTIIEPVSGYLACQTTGMGKMAEPSVLYDYIEAEIAREKDLKGLKILVTAGATRQAIDPVRYITNNSTGKMGYAIAKSAMLRGADVTLVTGKTDLPDVPFVTMKKIISAQDMFDEVTSISHKQDIIIKAAAVADYTPKAVSDQKIKKSDKDMSISLERTRDILAYLGENKRYNQFICGFSMETENLIENSRKKLIKKNVDMIAANSVKEEGAGFGTDTNILTLITADSETALPKMSKSECADRLLDEILNKKNSR